MPQGKNSRTSMDVLRDLATIRSGSMPDGSKAPAAPRQQTVTDPIERRRLETAARRNRGELRDVNLPAKR